LKPCKAVAKGLTYGQKAFVCTREEDDETDKGVDDTDADAEQLAHGKGAREDLEDQRKGNDGKECDRNVGGVLGKAVKICCGNGRRGDASQRIRRVEQKLRGAVRKILYGEADAKDHDRNDRTDAAKRDETEGVVMLLLGRADAGDTRTDGHDEGDGHRTCGHASRVECQCPEARVDLCAEDKGDGVKSDQQPGEADAEEYAKHGDDEKHAHARRDGEDQKPTGAPFEYLVGKDLKVRLGNGDENTDEEADQSDQPYLTRLCQMCTDLGTDGLHRHLGTRGEDRKPEDKTDNTEHKQKKSGGIHRRESNGKQGNDQSDRKDRLKGFPEL